MDKRLWDEWELGRLISRGDNYRDVIYIYRITNFEEIISLRVDHQHVTSSKWLILIVSVSVMAKFLIAFVIALLSRIVLGSVNKEAMLYAPITNTTNPFGRRLLEACYGRLLYYIIYCRTTYRVYIETWGYCNNTLQRWYYQRFLVTNRCHLYWWLLWIVSNNYILPVGRDRNNKLCEVSKWVSLWE